MSPRRLISILSVCVLASASVVAAQPTKGAKKDVKKAAKGPMAPAKGSAAGTPTPADPSAAPAAGSGNGSGEAVQMTEDAPPKDMNGTDENPDAPRDVGGEAKVVAVAPAMTRAPGYPVEEALRPLTLPQSLSEISISPHFQASPYAGSDALRARYGITPQVQLGFTYVMYGVFEDPTTMKQKFHAGKAAGLDVTVVLQRWLAVRGGVASYFDPLAFGLQLGAPIKFTFGDKVAIGGLDDLLSIRISKFAPTFYSEQQNAAAAASLMSHTEQSRGHLRFSGYGIYQYATKTALIGRIGLDDDLGTGGGGSAGTSSTSPTTMFVRAGLSLTPRKSVDVGGSVGFDDLAHAGSFGLALSLAVRI